MEKEELDTLRVVLQPYILDMLRSMEEKPKRFSELNVIISNERTLSLKLVKLMDYGLVESVAIKQGRKHINCYKLSGKGKRVLDNLGKLGKME